MPIQLASRPTSAGADCRRDPTAAQELAGLLRDGTAVWVRPMVAADRAWYGEFINHLSQPSRYSRFLSTWATIPASLLDSLVDVDGIDHIALVGLIAADGATPPPSWSDPASLPVGVARLVRNDTCPYDGEIGYEVADEWHGRGIGSLLVDALITRARTLGFTQVTADILINNSPSLKLIKHTGQIVGKQSTGAVLEVQVQLSVPPAITAPDNIPPPTDTAALPIAHANGS
jgi:GNAT superfamily N-acetyltransferase